MHTPRLRFPKSCKAKVGKVPTAPQSATASFTHALHGLRSFTDYGAVVLVYAAGKSVLRANTGDLVV